MTPPFAKDGGKALGIAGQDIHALSLALLSENGVEQEQIIPAAPEEYLAVIALALQAWRISSEDLTHVVVVRGPGSFTASRVSTILANTLVFTKRLPLIAMENPDHKSWKELAPAIPWSEASRDQWVLPLYDRPPHITLPS